MTTRTSSQQRQLDREKASQILTLEDARTIERFYLIEQRHVFPPKEHMTRLAIVQVMMAINTIERHLPVPIALGFDHCFRIGWHQAQGMTYIPLRDPLVSKLTGFDRARLGGGGGDQPAKGRRDASRCG